MTAPSTTGVSPREALEAEAKDNLCVLAELDPTGRQVFIERAIGRKERCNARLAQLDEAALALLVHHTGKAKRLLGE